jgi:hypothetical protein
MTTLLAAVYISKRIDFFRNRYVNAGRARAPLTSDEFGRPMTSTRHIAGAAGRKES